jgi:hypothetical protein
MLSMVSCAHSPTQLVKSAICSGVQLIVTEQTTTIPANAAQPSVGTVSGPPKTQSLAIAEAASEPVLLSPSALVYDRSL